MTDPFHILLAEDDATFGNILRDYLSLNGYSVQLCRDGSEALNAFLERDFDLVVTDVMMPAKDGFTFVSELKKVNPLVPVIYLTARNSKEDIIRGYQSGADDYITKPFDSDVLLHKINVVITRHSAQKSKESGEFGEFGIGILVFNPVNRTLGANDVTERLSPREAEILQILATNKGEIVNRTVLLNKVWGDGSYFNNRSLDVYVTKLRKRLAADSKIQIESLYGSGLRLIW
jgi:hypothetical protein